MAEDKHTLRKLWLPVLFGCAVATAGIALVAGGPAPAGAHGFRASEAFTFLLLSIGPAHAITGFAGLTAGRDPAFKRRLALYGTGAAALAILLAGTIGVSFLEKWSVSLPALAFAAGLLLLLVALAKLLGLRDITHASPSGDGPPPQAIDLAFSPLATPTIIPPFGMAVIILLLALAQQRAEILTLAGLILLVLAIDLLAMLFADGILKIGALRYGMLLVNTILGVLQVALAVQTIANAVRALTLP